jgi:tape measure domain-containing protein
MTTPLESLGIVVEIKPDVSGSAVVDRALKRNEDTGKATNAEIAKAAKEAARAQAKAAKEAEEAVRQHQRAIAAEARAAANAGKVAARDETRARVAAQREAAASARLNQQRITQGARAAANAGKLAVKDEARAASAARREAADAARAAKRAEVAAARAAAREEVAIAKEAARQVRIARQANASQAADLIGFGGGGARGGRGAGSPAPGLGMSDAIGAAAGAYGAREIIEMADAWTNAENRIKQLAKSETELVFVQDKLFESANKVRVNFEDHVALYQKVGKAAIGLGRTQEQAIGITELITKALKASGAEGASASAALAQLGQALDSGVLRGEEFNSMSEQAPILLDLLAKSLGVTRGELRKMAEDGKLTSQVVIEGLEKQGAAVEEAYGKRMPTITEGWTKFRNELTRTFGELAQNANVTAVFSEMLAGIASTIKGIADVVGIAASGISAFNSALGGLPGEAVSKLIEFGKYGMPGIGQFLAAKDLYHYFAGPDQQVAHTGDDLNIEARIKMGRRADRWSRGAGGAPRRGNTGLDSSHVPEGTDARDLGANGIFLQEETAERFAEQEKILEAAVRNHKKKLGRFMGDKTKKPKDVESWTHVFSDLAGAVDQYTASARAAVELGVGDLVEGFDEVRAEQVRKDLAAQKEVYDAIWGSTNRWLELQTAARAELDRGAISLQQYNDYLAELKDQYGGGATNPLDEMWKRQLEDQSRVEEQLKTIRTGFAETFGEIGRGLLDMARTGQGSFEDLANNAIDAIHRILLEMGLLEGARALFGSDSGAFDTASQLIGSIFGGGRAGGGTYTVPGSGGVDSRDVRFRVTPGERITFTPPGQMAPGGGGGAGGAGGAANVTVPVHVVNVFDAKQAAIAAMRTPEGARVVMNIIEDHADAIAARVRQAT